MLHRLIGDQVRLSLHLAGEPAWVLADRGELSQVLLNLAVNARDAMPHGGTLTVGTYVDPLADRVVLLVRDTGAGMDEATKARIFEPFFTTKARGQGTGLGLATVFGVVSRLGGRIEVDSEPGMGAVFRVELPRSEPPRTAAAVGAAAGDHSGEGTVLVVDDEEEIVELVRRVLEAHGYRVVPATGPGAALLRFAEQQGAVDLLLTDVVMPGMNGRVLAERIHELHPSLPVLYMSGHTDQLLDEPDADPQAPTALLSKPFSPSRLSEAVRAMLEGDAGARSVHTLALP
jgi:CheY-like chemotaxis protein